MIRPATPDDAEGIVRIYNHYIRDTVITFEEEAITAGTMAKRIESGVNAGFPWLVAEEDGAVLGYAYAGPWHPRYAYRFSVEVTVYLDPDAGGRGLGSQLYESLFEALMGLGVHAVIGLIALPNPASEALHQKFGMTPAGKLHEVGYKFDRWVDVGLWQRTLTADR
ncbi:GNAT family N-acetyltransferase [Marinobacter bohaiensis]|uniref:GNAT family N-acetyltransferase n=1 Tax=Marinobacter bohaiensis TaxID=2201898 RepID=UPI000DAE54AE|nr:GNAT family N-acetyltransferase [Marinobacter bohaiensis]